MNNIDARDSTINPQLEQYRAQAHERGVQPLSSSNHFLAVDGLEYETLLGEKSRIPRNTDQTIFEERSGQIGTYSGNNGMLAFVDSDGRMNIGYGTKSNVAILEQAGYKRAALHVPLSNGELPTDKREKDRFTSFLLEGVELKELEDKEKYLEGTQTVDRAKPMVKDLAEDDESLVHFAQIGNLLSIFRFGILSHITAGKSGMMLQELSRPIAQKKHWVWAIAPGGKGMDYISVFDPQLGERPTNTLDIIQNGVGRVIVGGSPYADERSRHMIMHILISGNIRQSPDFLPEEFLPGEAFIRRRVPKRDFEGLAVDEELLNRSANWFSELYMSQRGSSYEDSPRRFFLNTFSGDEELDALRQKFTVSEEKLKQAIFAYARVCGREDASVNGSPGVVFMKWSENKDQLNIDLDDPYHIREFVKFVSEVKQEYTKKKEASENVNMNDVFRSVRERVRVLIRQVTSDSAPEEILSALDNVLEFREARYSAEEKLIQRQFEKVMGKPFKDATMEDVLTGICGQIGIPLCTREGKVVWPKED